MERDVRLLGLYLAFVNSELRLLLLFQCGSTAGCRKLFYNFTSCSKTRDHTEGGEWRLKPWKVSVKDPEHRFHFFLSCVCPERVFQVLTLGQLEFETTAEFSPVLCTVLSSPCCRYSSAKFDFAALWNFAALFHISVIRISPRTDTWMRLSLFTVSSRPEAPPQHPVVCPSPALCLSSAPTQHFCVRRSSVCCTLQQWTELGVTPSPSLSLLGGRRAGRQPDHLPPERNRWMVGFGRDAYDSQHWYNIIKPLEGGRFKSSSKARWGEWSALEMCKQATDGGEWKETWGQIIDPERERGLYAIWGFRTHNHTTSAAKGPKTTTTFTTKLRHRWQTLKQLRLTTIFSNFYMLEFGFVVSYTQSSNKRDISPAEITNPISESQTHHIPPETWLRLLMWSFFCHDINSSA